MGEHVKTLSGRWIWMARFGEMRIYSFSLNTAAYVANFVAKKRDQKDVPLHAMLIHIEPWPCSTGDVIG